MYVPSYMSVPVLCVLGGSCFALKPLLLPLPLRRAFLPTRAVENEEKIRRAIARHEAEAAEERRRRQEAVNQALREQTLSRQFTESAKLSVSGAPAVRETDFAPLGVSSMQVFDGEDLLEGDRRLMQAAQVQ